MAQIKVSQCKVCKSKYRHTIEMLYTKGMSPEKIYDYLHSFKDPESIQNVEEEKLTPSGIRRHLTNHFDVVESALITNADVEQKIISAREKYNEGKADTINKVNLISLQIDTALAKMESIDTFFSPNDKTGHELYIKYMTTILKLTESLAKLTGELKQEGTIDINFFGTEITKFAELVLLAIRRVDRELMLEGKLEDMFGEQFRKLWEDYLTLQTKKINGEVDLNYGNYNINTFNETDL